MGEPGPGLDFGDSGPGLEVLYPGMEAYSLAQLLVVHPLDMGEPGPGLEAGDPVPGL